MLGFGLVLGLKCSPLSSATFLGFLVCRKDALGCPLSRLLLEGAFSMALLVTLFLLYFLLVSLLLMLGLAHLVVLLLAYPFS